MHTGSIYGGLPCVGKATPGRFIRAHTHQQVDTHAYNKSCHASSTYCTTPYFCHNLTPTPHSAMHVSAVTFFHTNHQAAKHHAQYDRHQCSVGLLIANPLLPAALLQRCKGRSKRVFFMRPGSLMLPAHAAQHSTPATPPATCQDTVHVIPHMRLLVVIRDKSQRVDTHCHTVREPRYIPCIHSTMSCNLAAQITLPRQQHSCNDNGKNAKTLLSVAPSHPRALKSASRLPNPLPQMHEQIPINSRGCCFAANSDGAQTAVGLFHAMHWYTHR
jgi:hypothetical protein